MIGSPGMSRKFIRAILKQLLLSEKRKGYSRKSVPKGRQPSEWSLGNRSSASNSLTPLLSRLSWFRESLGDESGLSGAYCPVVDRYRSRYLADGVVAISTILKGVV